MYFDPPTHHDTKKRYTTCLLFVVDALYIFKVHFEIHDISQQCAKILYFLHIKCFVIERQSDGNDMKATGGVATYVH